MKFLNYGDTGEKVKKLQRAINTCPHFELRRKLVVDGQMGTLTCAAVQQAKYRLGYEKEDIDPDVKDQIAGARLMDLLTGEVQLSKEYKARASARRKALLKKQKTRSTQTKMRLLALAHAKEELGTIERGGNTNRIKYNDWWGWGAVAYCVIGLSYCWVKARSEAFKKGSRWAGTDLMLSDGKAGHNGIHLTHDPDPGCPGVIDFDGHSDPDHAITFVKNNGDGTCETIEFNTTSNASGIAGVWRKDRPLRNCWWFEVEK